MTAAAPLLDSTYELTSVANFTETITNVAPGFSTITVGSGSFKIYADTTKDRSFSSDSGFSDGGLILSGTILGGSGSASAMSGVIIGVTQLNIRIDSYDHNVFDPDTIVGGNGIFTLRFGDSSDNPLLTPITQVQGVTYNFGDLKMAADGYVALTVPEPETWAMLVAGLGLVGLQLRRRTKTGMLSIN